MADVTSDGLIVSVRESGENDRLVTMLTPELGRIRVLVKGGRSIRGMQGTATQLFTYGNFELVKKGDLYRFRGGSADRVFFPFRTPVERSALMYYLAEVACEVTDENEPAGEVLRMLLNAFYLLSSEEAFSDFCRNRTAALPLLKAAFEFRTAVVAGYAPELTETCALCGRENPPDYWYLDVDNGRILCPDCVGKLGRDAVLVKETDKPVRNTFCPLSSAALSAVQYVCTAPQKRLYFCDLEKERDLADFSSAAEAYLLHHLERGFSTLEFYKTVSTS